MATLRDTWREDIIWHVKGARQLYGDYHGPDEVFGLLGKFAEETGGTFRLDVHAILAGDGVLGSHHRPGPQLWTSGSSCWATVTQPAGQLPSVDLAGSVVHNLGCRDHSGEPRHSSGRIGAPATLGCRFVERCQLWGTPSSRHMMLPSLSLNHAALPISGIEATSPCHSTPGISW
jgi:hypothetical protein